MLFLQWRGAFLEVARCLQDAQREPCELALCSGELGVPPGVVPLWDSVLGTSNSSFLVDDLYTSVVYELIMNQNTLEQIAPLCVLFHYPPEPASELFFPLFYLLNTDACNEVM